MKYLKALTASQARQYVSRLPDIISLDTEYDNLDVRQASLLSISVGTADCAYLFKPEHLRELEALKHKRLIFYQNYVVDHQVLLRHGFDLTKTPFLDTMLMEHLIDENLDHGLGDMALRYDNDDYKDVFWKKYKHFQDATEEDADQYEMRDAIYTYRYGMQFLDALRGKDALVEHVHLLAQALNETEVRGVRVDVELIQKTKTEMSAEIESFLPRLKHEFRDHCTVWELGKWTEEIAKRKTDKGKALVQRPEFSFSSDLQLRWLVYDERGLRCPVIEKTKKGNPSTDFDTLSKLAEDYPALETLVKYKGAKAVYSTFVEGLLDRVVGGRIYPRFSVNGTVTGRISSSNPNLQNIPSEGVIRNFFLPDPGRVLIGADFSQLEIIVEANITKDPELSRIIKEGLSKHNVTAEGLSLDRDLGKKLNFTCQYGGQPPKIAKTLGVSLQKAEAIFDDYWNLYAGVKAKKEEAARIVAECGEITNLFGRTRRFPPPKNKWEKAKQDRMAYNFLVQGVGADLCNRATYLFYDRLKKNGHGELWYSIHDEIIAQVKPEYAEEEKRALVEIMESLTEFIGFEIPLQSKAYGPFDSWRKA